MAALPDYLIDQTQDAILQRMISNLPTGLDSAEGSYIWDALSPASIELALAAIWAQQVLQYGFASTTYGAYLDMKGNEVGLPRKAATYAVWTETINGTPGTSIPNGTVICTPADKATNTESVEFVTQADVVIGESGSVNAQFKAAVAGAGGNVPVGTITVLSKPISGVSSVTNTSLVTEAIDTESDADYLVRYLAKAQNPGTSGNKADYINWATSVSGVGAAKCIPLWNGNGTVKVVLLGTDKLPASADIVTAVHILIDPGGGTGEGEAPIGATVTVVAATAVNINVTATMTLTGTKTLAEVQAAFQTALSTYLAGIAFASDPTVRYVRIGSLLLDTDGVQDYSNLQINSGTANITIAADQVAVRGTVTLS